MGIKDCSVLNDRKNFLDQPVKNDLITYENTQKNEEDYQEEDDTTDCSLDYNYFDNCCKMIEIYLSKQQALYADHYYSFIIEEAKETIPQGTVRVLQFYFVLT